MRRFRIHEKREKHSRAMLSLAIIIISVSIIANMRTTGFASLSHSELIDIAMESEHAKRLASENNYAVEITGLDAGVLSSSSVYLGVPEGAYEVKFVSGRNKLTHNDASIGSTVSVIVYNGEVFRTIVG